MSAYRIKPTLRRNGPTTKKKHKSNSRNTSDLEQQVIEFNKNAQKTLGDQTQRLRKGRLGEIQTVISAKAKELGYDWVIDSSQDVMLPRTPTVLFTNGKNDITAVVIEIINKDAVGKYKPSEPELPAEPNAFEPPPPSGYREITALDSFKGEPRSASPRFCVTNLLLVQAGKIDFLSLIQ